MDYNQQRANAQFSAAVDERLKGESGHCREVPAWKKLDKDLGSKFFTIDDVKAKSSEQNNELAVCRVGKNSRILDVSDTRARVIGAMNGPGTGVDGILIQMDRMMSKLQENLALPIRTGFRAACEDLINLSVADSTAAFVGAFLAAGLRSLPTAEVTSTRDETHMDVEVVPSEYVQPPAEPGDTSAI